MKLNEDERKHLTVVLFQAAARHLNISSKTLNDNIIRHVRKQNPVDNAIDAQSILALAHAVCDVMAEVCPLLPPKE